MKEDSYKTNSYYEGMLQNYYGGAKGCFSAFMHFFYQYNQSLVFNEKISNCFKVLYGLELENSQILSEILIKMGGDNKYYSCSKQFLSGYNVDYIKNFSHVFLYDIEMLECSIIELKNIIFKIENEKIRVQLRGVLENKKKELRLLKEDFFKGNIIDKNSKK